MQGSSETVRLITDTNLRGFFQDAVTEAMERRRVVADDLTVVYVVNLLASFLRSEDFYTRTPEGLELQPLAMVYAEALLREAGIDPVAAGSTPLGCH